MEFIPVIVVVLFAALFSPSSGKRRRKSKGFFETLIAGQKSTERRNGSHRGVMCGPGGSKRRK